MTPIEIVVTIAGLAAIAWVNWYFLFSQAPAAAVAQTEGIQRVAIEVQGGYDPATVRVRAGRPVRLEFHRTETSSCSEEVVLADFGIRRFLPAHHTTSVDFTPSEPGVHEFACGMGMLRGRIVVEPAEG